MKHYIRQMNQKGYTALIPLVLSIIIVFALLFVGNFVNGTIHNELESGYSACEGVKAKLAMNNTSNNWNSALDIVQVTIIITVLAAAIGAIFMFTKFT